MDNNNINNNNIDNENTEKATFMDRVKGFVKNHKIPTVITALVLVLAIGTGVVFGVTRHNSNIGEFPTFSSDETGSDIDVPAIEDDEDTSSKTESTDSEYTASTVITQTSTPDKSTSSTVSIEQPSTSTPEYPTTSTTTSTTTPTTSTPSTSTPSTSTPSTSTWTCPDASVHPEFDAVYCYSETEHNRLIQNHQDWLDRQQNSTDTKPDPNMCSRCHRYFGNGMNGTCDSHFDENINGGCYVCSDKDICWRCGRQYGDGTNNTCCPVYDSSNWCYNCSN